MNNNNRNNNNRRRGRGNNNRQQGGPQVNRIDSRARGNAPQLLEKYRKLAHDSHLNGDRVTEEYYLQFADHYFRVLADQRQRQEEQRQPRREDRPNEYGDDFAEDDFYGDAHSPYAPNSSANGSTGNGGYNGGGQNGAQNSGGQNGGGESRGEPRQEREPRQDREPRQEREPRQDREPRAEREPRQDREGRSERGRRPERTERAPVTQAPSAEALAAEPVGDAQLTAQSAVQGEAPVYEPAENPFLRESRAPRARKPRRSRDDAGEPEATAADAPAFDHAMLPPAISSRKEAPAVTEAAGDAPAPESATDEAPAKPKRRTRRAAPSEDNTGTPETVN